MPLPEEHVPATPHEQARPWHLSGRWGPIASLGVTTGPPPGKSAGVSASLGARFSLRKPDGGSDFCPTAAVLLGYDQPDPETHELTVGARLELLGSRDREVLLPYFYGYVFAAGGRVNARSSPGVTARAGVGLGWNTPASNRFPEVFFGRYGEGLFIWLLMFVPAHVEAYYQFAQVGSQAVEGARLGIGIAL